MNERKIENIVYKTEQFKQMIEMLENMRVHEIGDMYWDIMNDMITYSGQNDDSDNPTENGTHKFLELSMYMLWDYLKNERKLTNEQIDEITMK